MNIEKSPMFKSDGNNSIRQFISYFFVGGVSALVEWISFYLSGSWFGIQYLPATGLAFVISTTTNWFLGRTITFNGSQMGRNKAKEIILVFGVSAIGLLGNLALMFLFVDILRMNTELLKLVGKIASTGIVFIWNYLSRKLWIYKT